MLNRLRDPQVLESFRALLLRAQARREPLERDPSTTAYRLVNADGDGLPGLTVDVFAGTLVASLYEDLEPDLERMMLEALAATLEPHAIYLKRRPKEARHVANTEREHLAPDAPEFGVAHAEVVALEGGRRYLIRPGGDLSVGLFLDMRDVRSWLAPRVRGERVLNTFAYTCGFGLVAALGGAARAVNLDLSRKVLDWGMENYALNGLEAERQDFISGDVFDWLNRMRRWDDRFGVLVLDPPSFARSKLRRFSVNSDYADLMELAAPLVSPGGLILACCNSAGLARTQFMAMVRKGFDRAGRRFELEASLYQPKLDFPVPDTLEAPLKVFALRV